MSSAITTAEELLRAGRIGRCELVRGRLVMMNPTGYDHGRVAGRLAVAIGNHVQAFGLGTFCAAETGFLLSRNPDTVRAPDAAFVRAGREPATSAGFFPGPPDLAVEVLSPDDRPGDVREKTAEWLDGGARSVWIADPRKRTVTIHEPGREPLRLGEADTLRGGDVLPGFKLPVRELFG